MKYINQCFIIGCLVMTLSACVDDKDKELILGEWKGTEWLVNGGPSSYVPEMVTFTFNDDAEYTFQYGDSVEAGKYFISNKQLFTTPDGGMKIMVKVLKLTDDALVFDMNRGGQSEQLTLTRK